MKFLDNVGIYKCNLFMLVCGYINVICLSWFVFVEELEDFFLKETYLVVNMIIQIHFFTLPYMNNNQGA